MKMKHLAGGLSTMSITSATYAMALTRSEDRVDYLHIWERGADRLEVVKPGSVDEAGPLCS